MEPNKHKHNWSVYTTKEGCLVESWDELLRSPPLQGEQNDETHQHIVLSTQRPLPPARKPERQRLWPQNR